MSEGGRGCRPENGFPVGYFCRRYIRVHGTLSPQRSDKFLLPQHWCHDFEFDPDQMPQNPMSALGHKRSSGRDQIMSALPPNADVDHDNGNVCFVPLADMNL
jgi:hypothetical protein